MISTSAPRAFSRGMQRRTTIRVLAGIATVVALAAPIAGASTARHIRLVSSSPAKDAHVMAPVSEIRLTFSGRVDVTKASAELVASDSSTVRVSALAAVPDSNQVAVAKVLLPLKNGTYTVRWKAIAADGAAGSGSFSFMYMAAASK